MSLSRFLLLAPALLAAEALAEVRAGFGAETLLQKVRGSTELASGDEKVVWGQSSYTHPDRIGLFEMAEKIEVLGGSSVSGKRLAEGELNLGATRQWSRQSLYLAAVTRHGYDGLGLVRHSVKEQYELRNLTPAQRQRFNLVTALAVHKYKINAKSSLETLLWASSLDRGFFTKSFLLDTKWRKPFTPTLTLLTALTAFEYRYGEEVSQTLGPEVGLAWQAQPALIATLEVGAKKARTPQRTKTSQSWELGVKKIWGRGEGLFAYGRTLSPAAASGFMQEDSFIIDLAYSLSKRGVLKLNRTQAAEESLGASAEKERQRATTLLSYTYGIGRAEPQEHEDEDEKEKQNPEVHERYSQELSLAYEAEELSVKDGLTARRNLLRLSWSGAF